MYNHSIVKRNLACLQLTSCDIEPLECSVLPRCLMSVTMGKGKLFKSIGQILSVFMTGVTENYTFCF